MPSDLKQIKTYITPEQWQVTQELMQKLDMPLAALVRQGLAELAAQNQLDDIPFYQHPQHGGNRKYSKK